MIYESILSNQYREMDKWCCGKQPLRRLQWAGASLPERRREAGDPFLEPGACGPSAPGALFVRSAPLYGETLAEVPSGSAKLDPAPLPGRGNFHPCSCLVTHAATPTSRKEWEYWVCTVHWMYSSGLITQAHHTRKRTCIWTVKRPLNKGLILPFYPGFYGFLAALFSFTMWAMFQNLNHEVPKYRDQIV